MLDNLSKARALTFSSSTSILAKWSTGVVELASSLRIVAVVLAVAGLKVV